MSTGLRGLPVFCSRRERAVGFVEGSLISPEGGEELLVRSGEPADPVVRRVAAVHVTLAGSSGVLLNLDLERFLAQPLHQR
jgi:hypothetical protein